MQFGLGLYYKPLPRDHNEPEKELHWSPWVNPKDSEQSLTRQSSCRIGAAEFLVPLGETPAVACFTLS